MNSSRTSGSASHRNTAMTQPVSRSSPFTIRAIKQASPAAGERPPARRAYSTGGILRLMDRIDPSDVLRLFHRLDVEIDHHRLVVGTHQHAFQHFVGAGVDFLVRHVRRHVDKVSGSGLGDEFEIVAPAHARLAAQHIDHAFERAVVVRAGFGVGMNVHGAGPDFLRANAGEVDRRLAVHAERLCGVGIERVARDHAHTVVLPFVVVAMIVTHGLAPLSSSIYHCPRLTALAKRRASSAARNRALALLMHSCCSLSGFESATMPAPACTYILPSLTSAVRSTMQVSISPAAEK